MKKQAALWCVGYKWGVGDATRYAHTVVTAESQQAAEAWLQQRQTHITVMPLAEWKTERASALGLRSAAVAR